MDRPTILIGLTSEHRWAPEVEKIERDLRKQLPGYHVVLVPGMTSATVVQP